MAEEIENLPTPKPRRQWLFLTGRIARLIFGVALPLTVFEINEDAAGILRPDWDSGTWDMWSGLLLTPEAVRYFYPLLALAMVALVVREFWPRRAARSVWIWTGIIMGVVLALWFFMVMGPDNIGGALVISFLATFTFGWWAASPLLALVTYGYCLRLLVRDHRRDGAEKRKAKARDLLPPALAGVGLGGAAILAVTKAMELRETLPKEPPECYVCTASAFGHRRLVRPLFEIALHGRPVRVTRQLQVCKAMELLLAGRLPRIHRALRVVYDAMGPRLVRRMKGAYLADLGYILLKPAEWLFASILHFCLPNADSLIQCQYRRIRENPAKSS